jgi:hypothetical protein
VRRTRRPAAAFALCAIAVAGCGLGPGKGEGDVDLTVSRDYGRDVLTQKQDSINESDTVLRVLDRNADLTTRYGGGFVQSIDGLAGSTSGGRRSDWFFYVNGIESPIGSSDYDLSGGDRIWWDFRDWTAAMRVPAVVGSWPEPFLHGFEGTHWGVTVSCEGAPMPCDVATQQLTAAGARPGAQDSDAAASVVVGPWEKIRRDQVPGLLTRPPSESGVFARFEGDRRPVLDLLNERGEIAGSVGKGGGLVAALRSGDDPPVWVVTGTDDKGVAAAADLLGPALRNHYAVATQPGAGPIGVPVP